VIQWDKGSRWKFFFALVFVLVGATAEESVRLVVVSAESGGLVPCRIHLKGKDGKPVLAPGLPAWQDHFVCGGEVSLKLAPGDYSYEIERGPEFARIESKFTVAANQALSITNHFRRLVDMAKEGWWSGDLHVHRSLANIELLMRAEDLHIAPVMTWWNRMNLWTNGAPTNLLVQFDKDRFYQVMAGEDEREGGALLYFNLAQPLKIAGAQREFPSPMKFLAEARKFSNVWVDIEKPFWYDAPIWIASGMADSIGIANNHMYRSGMYPDEAWGRARDTNRWPAARDNGFWTQEIYYHALNCGIRLPPSAGSASGVLPNPVGYNRAYVQVEGALTYEKWWEGLRAGRVFVSNGPLLRATANGHLPGHVFKLKEGEKLNIDVFAKVDSDDGLGPLEVVKDGAVVASICGCSWDGTGPLAQLEFAESGWFLVRAFAEVPSTFRFASTGPFYVERADAPRRVSKTSAQFFVDWVREREGRVKLDKLSEREEVLRYHREAEKFWLDKVANANAK